MQGILWVTDYYIKCDWASNKHIQSLYPNITHLGHWETKYPFSVSSVSMLLPEQSTTCVNKRTQPLRLNPCLRNSFIPLCPVFLIPFVHLFLPHPSILILFTHDHRETISSVAPSCSLLLATLALVSEYLRYKTPIPHAPWRDCDVEESWGTLRMTTADRRKYG